MKTTEENENFLLARYLEKQNEPSEEQQAAADREIDYQIERRLEKEHQKCSCGRALVYPTEREEGKCCSCLQDEDYFEGHEHCNPERIADMIDHLSDEEAGK